MRTRFSAGDLYYLLGWLGQGFGDRVFARRDELVGAADALATAQLLGVQAVRAAV